MKISLWQLVTAGVAIAGVMLTSYMKNERTADLVQQLSTQIISLQADIKAGNTNGYAMNSTLNLMQFRMETAESDIRQLKNLPSVKK